MQIDSSVQGNHVVVRVTGRADSVASETLEQVLLQHIADGQVHLVMDFENLEYLSSSGLRVLIMAGKTTEQHGGSLTLARLSENIQEVPTVSGFIRLFTVAETVEKAIGQSSS